MPLRVTIELIPLGDETRKRNIAVVDIENDGTAGDMRGGGPVGNYTVRGAMEMEGGFDVNAAFTIGPLKRGCHIDTAIEVLNAMHSERMPSKGCLTGHVEVSTDGEGESVGKNELQGVIKK